MGTWGIFSGGKRQGREADHSLPPCAKSKNGGAITSTLPYVFMAWCLAVSLIKDGEQFIFTLSP
jgi:hypothetical protein